MKRKFLGVVLALCLIGAAGCSGQETKATESETQVTETQAGKETAESESDIEIQNKEISSGELYDFIISINPDAELTELENGLYLELPIHTSLSENIAEKVKINFETAEYYGQLIKILFDSNVLARYYDQSVIYMIVDGNAKGFITFTSIDDAGDFVSSKPIIIDKAYEDAMNTLYDASYASHEQ